MTDGLANQYMLKSIHKKILAVLKLLAPILLILRICMFSSEAACSNSLVFYCGLMEKIA